MNRREQQNKEETTRKLDDARKRREEDRKQAIENPDPNKEHQIYSLVPVDHKWHYEYRPEVDEIEFSHEERVEDGTNRGEYRCTCSTYEMSDSEAIEHIQKARSKSD